MKKFLLLASVFVATLLCAVMLFALPASAKVYSGTCGAGDDDTVRWWLDTNTGLLKITGSGEMADYVLTEDIPWSTYGSSIKTLEIGDHVTRIGDRAFSYCNLLTSVKIPDSVTSIGNCAFSPCDLLTSITVDPNNENYCSMDGNLYTKDQQTLIQYAVGKTDTTFVIPNSVTSIGDSAFSRCSSLTSVTIPDGVTSIGDSAFGFCRSLVSIIIPNRVTGIGDFAFSYCSSLTSITIPDSVVTIGDWAFSSCSSLTSIAIPDSVAIIGDYAFFLCQALTSITVDSNNKGYCSIDGNLYTKDQKTLIQYAIGKPETVFVIPNGVTSIGVSAFDNCASLTSITMPDSITSIGGSAFSGCTALTSVSLPKSVESIGTHAFDNCTALTNITIPNGVTSIGSYVFSGCTALTSISLPEGVESIESHAFYNCAALTSISVPDSVTSVGNSAFYGCIALTSIALPDGVERIGSKAFYNCNALTSMTIPFVGSNANDVTNTHFGYLFGASSYREHRTVVPATLKNVTITGGNIGNHAFADCESLVNVTLSDNVTSIGDSAFYGCRLLTSITIPNSVTSIGGSAFYGCRLLTSITIPNSVTSIGESAFAGCGSLTSITLPFAGATIDGTSDTYFGYIFKGHSLPPSSQYYYNTDVPASLKAVTITGKTRIDDFAFFGCASLKSVTIGEDVTGIGDEAFYGCNGITEIYFNATAMDDLSSENFAFSCSTVPANNVAVMIGANVTRIPAYLFYSFRSYGSNYTIFNITSVMFAEGCVCESIGEAAFQSCRSLMSITLPNGVTSIGDRAFYDCRGLTSFTIPNGVTSIGVLTFGGCSSLTNITIPDGVTSIGGNAFSNCIGLTSVTIPASVTNIGYEVFYACKSLVSVTIGNGVTNIERAMVIDCTALENVFYHGTKAEWDQKVTLGEYNEDLLQKLSFVDCTYEFLQKHDDAQHKLTCACGRAQYTAHEWNAGEVTVEPTVDAEGVRTFTCICGAIKTEPIEKLPTAEVPDEGEQPDDGGDVPAEDENPDNGSTDTPDADKTPIEGDTEPADGVVGKLLGGCQSALIGGAGLMMMISLAGACLLAKKKED